ncbi:MarR family winged helix-turn-helix transcriptional regulator [Glaciibacter flavus]|uniref:MarR family winged helix-turn-helix transcriptional regulator n=1 Tax=Orlajensenia flava TaxID=2565934 RepID=UPI003B00276F
MDASRQTLVGELGRALQRYQRSVQAFDDEVGRAMGLGPADLRCLDWLTEGPLTAGQLSVATGLRPAATTALVDRLVARGLIERTSSPTDRRQVLVQLTDEGRRQTWAYYGPLVAAGAPLLAELSEEQLTFMRDYLSTITDITERHRERVEGERG